MPSGSATGLTLGIRTRGEAIGEMASWVGANDDADLLALARQFWESSLRTFNAWMWKFNRRTQSITLVDQTREYNLNTDFRNPLAANLSDANGRPSQPLPYKAFAGMEKDYATAESSLETGVPTLYFVRSPESDAVVVVAPMPITGAGAGRVLRLRYHVRIASPSSDTASMTVPQAVDQAIYWDALYGFLGAKGADTRKIAMSQAEKTRLFRQVVHEYEDFPDPELLDHTLWL